MTVQRALVKNGSVVEITTFSDEEAAVVDETCKRVDDVPMWRPYTRTPDPAFDPATHKLVDDPRVIADDGVTDSRSVVALTQQEIDDAAEEADISNLQTAGRDIAVVLVELVDQLLLDSTIQLTDFTPAVKQNYLDIKAIADRVK
jgi:hypothetical protein